MNVKFLTLLGNAKKNTVRNTVLPAYFVPVYLVNRLSRNFFESPPSLNFTILNRISRQPAM